MVEKLGSVGSWLRTLRYSTECYDYIVTNSENSESDDDMDYSRRNSGEYVNIWECESERNPKHNGNSGYTHDNVSSVSFVGANNGPSVTERQFTLLENSEPTHGNATSLKVSGSKHLDVTAGQFTLPENSDITHGNVTSENVSGLRDYNVNDREFTLTARENTKRSASSTESGSCETTNKETSSQRVFNNTLLDRFRTTENSEYLDAYLRYLRDLDANNTGVCGNVPAVLNSSESIDSWYSFQVSESSSESSINLSDINSDLDESVSSYIYYNGKDNSYENCSDYFTDVVSLNSSFDEDSVYCNCKSQEFEKVNRQNETEHIYANLTELRTRSGSLKTVDIEPQDSRTAHSSYRNKERIYENVSAIFPNRPNVNVNPQRLNIGESFRSNPETSSSRGTVHFGNSKFYLDVNVDDTFHKRLSGIHVSDSETLGPHNVRETFTSKPDILSLQNKEEGIYSNVDVWNKRYGNFTGKNVRNVKTLRKRSISETSLPERDLEELIACTRLTHEDNKVVVDDLLDEDNFLRKDRIIGNSGESSEIYEVHSIKNNPSDANIQGERKSAPLLNLNFGKICRVSVNFNENIEEFEVARPIRIEQLVPELPLDVMVWKEGIRFSYWEEEENIMENNEELLKSFNQLPKEKFSKSDNRFPLDENDEDEVQIRENHSGNRFLRANHSKTTDGTLGRRIFHNRYKKFDIRGLTKIQLPNERSPLKLSHEYVMYDNDEMYRVNEVNNAKVLLRRNVILKSARPTNNKNVELKDCNNLTYTLYFDSSKDAKTFIESENVQGYVNNDTKTTITKTLLKLLGKRSSREILEKKGIYKNEPIFGNTLRDIYTKGGNEVPPFIYKVIELIERPENITSLGLYRTSGNLATIQKIRFEVDNGRLDILDEFSKDVDVLTGSLKLFFRELKEPLITCEVCDEILGSIKPEQKTFTTKDKEKLRTILSKNLHEANIETLFVLLRHLLEVVKFKEDNKMDPYNLAVCWGPSSIFSVNQELSRDIVTQSQDATRLIEFLLNFYKDNQDELYHFGTKKLDRCPLIRNGSKDSLGSHDSSINKNTKKSASTSSLSVDEIIKKTVEIIEFNITSEGLYKKSGSVEKTNKIMKKLTKKKIHELDKHKNDVYDVTDALKKYLRESPEVFVTKETVDKVLAIAEPFQKTSLDLKSAQSIETQIENTPKKDTFIYLLRHILKVVENQTFHKVSKLDIINIWTNVLNFQKKSHPSNERFAKFLTVVLEVFDENSKFEKSEIVAQKSNVALNNVLKDLRSQQERDRYSRYDNVSDNESRGEARILDGKNENTKL